MVSDAQVRRLMQEMKDHDRVGLASLRSGMHRNTGRRYVASGELPSERRVVRSWRTRSDPFESDWPELLARLEDAPELEAKALFEDLLARHPGRYAEGQLRTFQRRVKQWRALHGPDKEVFFAQAHRPGEAMQTDFTRCGSLQVTIAGEPFDHQLCHSVLPYSNWQSASVCRSESMLALSSGVQKAVFSLGRVPDFHQTDNSTAATHTLTSRKRAFNEDYKALMRHLGMKPRTIAIGQKEQNGDIEAANGALKRRLTQHLLLRGSRDFDSVEAYQGWIDERLAQANILRSKRLAEELAVMTVLPAGRLATHRKLILRVSSRSTLRVKNNTYSVPSRLIGEKVTVRLSEMHLEVFYGGQRQLVTDRLCGEGKHAIDYRHLIVSLVKKPGAFARYRYREAMFPTPVFRRAYDALSEALSERQADLDYLRILKLAAETMQCEVEAILEQLAEGEEVPRFAVVEGLKRPEPQPVPALTPLIADLASYDALLQSEVGA